jgi:phosphatidate cytidylyltransferase
MKTRIISAIVGIVVLIGVLFCPFTWMFSAAATLLAMIAVWELLNNTGLVSQKWLTLCGMLFAGSEVLVCCYAEQLYAFHPVCGLLPLILLTVYAWFVLLLIFDERFGIGKSVASKVWLFTLYGTIGFVALARLRMMPNGLPYVLLPMVISWMSDTGAYFTGVCFGKHKMAPVISPKKTWEGFFGGWVISVGLTVLYGVICNAIVGSEVFNLLMLAVVAAVLAPLSVMGDLLASLIKRRTGIKDYGNIMPGHGGVMDRFDSVIFIAPLVLAALMLF